MSQQLTRFNSVGALKRTRDPEANLEELTSHVAGIALPGAEVDKDSPKIEGDIVQFSVKHNGQEKQVFCSFDPDGSARNIRICTVEEEV